MIQSIVFVTTTFNDSKYLHRLGSSISASTKHKHFWIVVNDGSNDLRSLSNYHALKPASSLQTIIKLSIENVGLASARNIGLSEVSSDFVRFVDADDYLVPSSTDDLIEKALEDDADIALGDYFLWNENHELTDWPIRNNAAITLNEWKSLPYAWETKFTIPIHSAVFRNLEIKFNEGMRNREDWVFWSKLSRSTKQVTILPSPVCGYVQHEQNMSSGRSVATCLAWLEAYDQIASIFPERYVEERPVMIQHFLRTYWDKTKPTEKSLFLSGEYKLSAPAKKLYSILEEFDLV